MRLLSVIACSALDSYKYICHEARSRSRILTESPPFYTVVMGNRSSASDQESTPLVPKPSARSHSDIDSNFRNNVDNNNEVRNNNDAVNIDNNDVSESGSLSCSLQPLNSPPERKYKRHGILIGDVASLGRLEAPERIELETPTTSQTEDNFKGFPTGTFFYMAVAFCWQTQTRGPDPD